MSFFRFQICHLMANTVWLCSTKSIHIGNFFINVIYITKTRCSSTLTIEHIIIALNQLVSKFCKIFHEINSHYLLFYHDYFRRQWRNWSRKILKMINQKVNLFLDIIKILYICLRFWTYFYRINCANLIILDWHFHL